MFFLWTNWGITKNHILGFLKIYSQELHLTAPVAIFAEEILEAEMKNNNWFQSHHLDISNL